MTFLNKSIFNFHDIVAVETRCASAFQKSFFDDEYEYHQVEAKPADLPTVNFTYTNLWNRTPEMVMYQHKVFAKFGYTIALDDDQIRINTAGNNIGIPIAHHMLLHTSLRYLTAQKGSVLLHSGAVAKNGKSLLFSGKGGAGKTTMTSLILSSNQGWNIHADDYVFLSEGKTRTYVTRAHLYRDLLRWVPQIKNKLTLKERIALTIFGFVRETSNEGIKWPVRMEFSRLWPNISIADTADPGGLILLTRDDVNTPSLVKNHDLDAVVDELVEMNFYEARHFIHLVKKAGVFSESWYRQWYDRERKNLGDFLSKVPLYTLVLPKRSTANSNQKVLSILEEIVS